MRALVLDGNVNEAVLAELRSNASLRRSVVELLHYAHAWHLPALAILTADESLREEVLQNVPVDVAEALAANLR